MTGLDPSVSFYPPPTKTIRLLGLGALIGAILWPVSLVILAGAASECASSTECLLDRGTIAAVSLAPIALALGLLGLERRAPRVLGMGDFVGDLSIGTAAVLFLVAFVAGSIGLVGPGLLLLLIGSLIFGIVGYFRGGRPKMASAIVAIGASGTLVFLAAGAIAVGGGDSASGLESAAIFALILFSIGWGWLGVDLLLGRPLEMPDRK